jgi:hypothetical protein
MNLRMAFSAGIGFLLLAGLALGQNPIPTYDKLPDWSGAWSMMGGTVFDRASQTGQGGALAVGVREHPPYNAEWEAKYQKNVALKDQGRFRMSSPTAACPRDFRECSTFRTRMSLPYVLKQPGFSPKTVQRDAHLHGRAQASR